MVFVIIVLFPLWFDTVVGVTAPSTKTRVGDIMHTSLRLLPRGVQKSLETVWGRRRSGASDLVCRGAY